MDFTKFRQLENEIEFIYDSLQVATDLEKIDLIERLNEIDAILETEYKKAKAKEKAIKG